MGGRNKGGGKGKGSGGRDGGRNMEDMRRSAEVA